MLVWWGWVWYAWFMTDVTEFENPYEDYRRALKAGRLASFLAAHYERQGVLDHAVQAVGQIGEDRWLEIADAVGVNVPSERTVWLVQDMLAGAEAAVDPNKS